MDVNQINPYDLGVATSFPDKAKQTVVEYYNMKADEGWDDLNRAPVYVEPIALDQVSVVWFAKTLQNWKAIVTTTIQDGRIYEVTYNGDKNETYVDVYEKKDNVVIPD